MIRFFEGSSIWRKMVIVINKAMRFAVRVVIFHIFSLKSDLLREAKLQFCLYIEIWNILNS